MTDFTLKNLKWPPVGHLNFFFEFFFANNFKIVVERQQRAAFVFVSEQLFLVNIVLHYNL